MRPSLPRPLALAILLVLPQALAAQAMAAARDTVYPGATWARIEPERAGYSRRGLDSARAILAGMQTSAAMVVVGGRTLLQYGDVAETSYVASVRKSILSMLYGRYVRSGTIRLDETLGELGMDDVGGLLPMEREATVEDLLEARSGVYHPASYAGDDLDSAPPRQSQRPGTYYLYSNWDFNAAGWAFEHRTGRDIYDALLTDLARPIGMEDYFRAGQAKQGDTTRSRYPAYPIVISTRDMARLGLLMLRGGRWNGREVVPELWVRLSTRVVTRNADMHPSTRVGPRLPGYGYLWWVYDRPDSTDPRWHAFAALGAFGQYILVLPKLDMVVAHKVVIRRPPFHQVPLADFDRFVDAVIAARR